MCDSLIASFFRVGLVYAQNVTRYGVGQGSVALSWWDDFEASDDIATIVGPETPMSTTRMSGRMRKRTLTRPLGRMRQVLSRSGQTNSRYLKKIVKTAMSSRWCASRRT